MRITDRKSALEFMNAWGENMRNGILEAAIWGNRACYGSAFQAGHEIEAAGYADADSVLTAGRVIEKLHAGI